MRGFACIIHYLVEGSVASQSLFQLHGTRISPQLVSTNGRDRTPNTAEAPRLQWRGPQALLQFGSVDAEVESSWRRFLVMAIALAAALVGQTVVCTTRRFS